MCLQGDNKLIEINDVTVDYGNCRAIEHISAVINKGDFVAITGPNGGGKSTLLKTLLHLLKPTAGTVVYHEAGHKLRFGYLPQKSNIDSRFPITVEEVVASGLFGNSGNWYGKYGEDAARRIEDTLSLMDITALRRRPIGTLSGGQLQRTLLGRAVIARPDVVVLDESLSYVDRVFVEQIYRIVEAISHVSTVVLVSHEMTKISEMANRHWIVDHALHECHAHHHYLHTECD